MKKKSHKLWGGRFQSANSITVEKILESISYDKILYPQDIQGSLAHTKMLYQQNILNKSEYTKIKKGLEIILEELNQNKMKFSVKLEDIHTHIENRLIEIIGADGKKLHTARSRNDQVATDTILYLKEKIIEQEKYLVGLLNLILKKANKYLTAIWAGYTHLQIAQPVYFSHYIMSYFFQFSRDLELLQFVKKEIDCSPLDSGALAGTNYNINNQSTAKLLQLSNVYQNSMDAISNRDYQLSYHFFASRLFIHISRFCEDMIIYSTAEFNYIKNSDEISTGSSIMPQKRNPDLAEVLRGKSSRTIGNFMSLLVTLKGLPSTYNRDLQEDKVYLFDSTNQVDLGLQGMQEILKNIQVDSKKIEENLEKGFSQATDFADHMVEKYKIPFREAHSLTGKLINYCEKEKIFLSSITNEKINEILPIKINLPKDYLTIEACLNRKKGYNSTSLESVKNQIAKAEQWLKNFFNANNFK